MKFLFVFTLFFFVHSSLFGGPENVKHIRPAPLNFGGPGSLNYDGPAPINFGGPSSLNFNGPSSLNTGGSGSAHIYVAIKRWNQARLGRYNSRRVERLQRYFFDPPSYTYEPIRSTTDYRDLGDISVMVNLVKNSLRINYVPPITGQRHAGSYSLMEEDFYAAAIDSAASDCLDAQLNSIAEALENLEAEIGFTRRHRNYPNFIRIYYQDHRQPRSYFSGLARLEALKGEISDFDLKETDFASTLGVAPGERIHFSIPLRPLSSPEVELDGRKTLIIRGIGNIHHFKARTRVFQPLVEYGSELRSEREEKLAESRCYIIPSQKIYNLLMSR